jgi:hypothetical protein
MSQRCAAPLRPNEKSRILLELEQLVAIAKEGEK